MFFVEGPGGWVMREAKVAVNDHIIDKEIGMANSVYLGYRFALPTIDR